MKRYTEHRLSPHAVKILGQLAAGVRKHNHGMASIALAERGLIDRGPSPVTGCCSLTETGKQALLIARREGY